MRLAHGRHLADCPIVPTDGSWAETSAALRESVLSMRDVVCRPDEGCGIGLRLGEQAVRELLMPRPLVEFRRWLEEQRCYVFTAGEPRTGNLYPPDWTQPERLVHACRVLDVLGELLPEGVEGSVSLSPGARQALNEPRRVKADLQVVYANLIHAAVHAAEVSGRTGRRLRLALEPAYLGLFEGSAEMVRFLEPLIEAFPDQFGGCVDAGYFAAGFEEPVRVLAALDDAEIPVVKMRLGAALRVYDGEAARAQLRILADGAGLCPVAVRRGNEKLRVYRDLDAALATPVMDGDEWRVQLRTPLHDLDGVVLGTTSDALPGVIDWLAANPGACPHLEIASCAGEERRDLGWALEALTGRGLA